MSELFQKIKSLYIGMKIEHAPYVKRGFRPRHDWNILLTGALVTLILITFFSLYFYRRIDQDKLFTVIQDDSDREVTIKSSLLEKVVSEIKERQKSVHDILQNKTIPPDPSL